MTLPAADATITRCRFFDYVEGTDNKIEQWLVGCPLKLARMRQALLYLSGLRQEQWPSVYVFKWLVKAKKYKDAALGEVRFRAEGLEQRVVGCFGTTAIHFILLIGFCKHQGNYFPPDPLDLALARKAKYLANPASVQERVLI